MHILSIDASKAQARKLAKGGSVRIKRGTGFNLIVHPTTYRLATRAFNKGKAIQVKLSKEELESNKAVEETPEAMEDHEEMDGEMTGQGLFSWLKGAFNTVKKFVTNPKTLKGLKQAGSFVADKGSDLASEAVKTLPGGAILSKGVKNLGVLANKGINDPDSIGGWEGAGKTMLTGHGMRGRGMHPSYGHSMHGHGFDWKKLLRDVGSVAAPQIASALASKGSGLHGYSALSAAGRASASANAGNSHYTSEGIRSRQTIEPTWHDDPFAPRSRGMGIIGHGGGMLGTHGHGYYPPAMVSQPYSANYQMNRFLPVPYQGYNMGMEGYDHDGNEEDSGDEMPHHRGHHGMGFGLYA